MRTTLPLLAAALGTAAVLDSTPVAAAPTAPVTIAASGEGPWYVRCDLDGLIDLIELSTARLTYTDNHLRSATCHYQASRTPLTITIAGAGWVCPFQGATEGACQLVVPRLRQGEFRLVRGGAGSR